MNLYRQVNHNFQFSARIFADFWKAEGYNEGNWQEEQLDVVKYIKLKKGIYSINMNYASNLKNGVYPSFIMLKLKIKKDVWVVKYFKSFAIIYILIGLIFLVIGIFKKNKKNKTVSGYIEDYINDKNDEIFTRRKTVFDWFLSRKDK